MTEYTKKSNIGDLDVILHFEYTPPEPLVGLYPGCNAEVTINAIQVGEDEPIYFDDDLEDIFQESLINQLEEECLRHMVDQAWEGGHEY